MSDDITELKKKAKAAKEKLQAAIYAKDTALGAGINKAINANLLSWDDFKDALEEVVTTKKDRKILGLPELETEPEPEKKKEMLPHEIQRQKIIEDAKNS